MANEQNLKPFKKGDVKINRNGRPKSFDTLRKLTQQILAEEVLDKDGNPVVIRDHAVTQVELILRAWATDKKKQQQLLEIAYGKVPTPVEHSGTDGQPIAIAIVKMDMDEL